ncbi:hypothetical protein [Xenorhabdus innexi]|uniref:Uncharacterized protein n=1 Tax=Xenorhabdus innexi TaxID=290109 RepID=A0A1N6N016_9GAMM|nr:hypothetical protein [Xenorhabdus innexi]PHM37727.1 hypothetical protein Xinn_00825 [Xenorhabdus innexi]SIP74436.1 hypothetical protein XIS1_620009 [Xenorhabdus innexi]
MNTQSKKPDKTTKKDNVLPDTPIREKQTVTLNQNATSSTSNIFGFGYSHANFSYSHFGA